MTDSEMTVLASAAIVGFGVRPPEPFDPLNHGDQANYLAQRLMLRVKERGHLWVASGAWKASDGFVYSIGLTDKDRNRAIVMVAAELEMAKGRWGGLRAKPEPMTDDSKTI